MRIADSILRLGASLVAPSGPGSRLAILMYHRVMPEPDVLTDSIDAATFDAHMTALSRCFNVLPLADAVARLTAGTLPPRPAAITFDDGYSDNLHVALPILERHRLHATFFIASGFLDGGRMFNDTVIEAVRRLSGPTLDLPAAGLSRIAVGSLAEKRAALERVLHAVKYLSLDQRELAAEQISGVAGARLPDDLMMTSEELLRLARAGMGIGGHTIHHPILARLGVDEARREITDNKAALEALVGQRLDLFAYPNGVPTQDYAAEHVTLVRHAGYRAAVSTSWGAATMRSDRFQLPRFTPWDREPTRFIARLLHNSVARRPVELATAPGG